MLVCILDLCKSSLTSLIPKAKRDQESQINCEMDSPSQTLHRTTAIPPLKHYIPTHNVTLKIVPDSRLLCHSVIFTPNDLIDLLKNSTLPPLTKKQYITQASKILGMLDWTTEMWNSDPNSTFPDILQSYLRDHFKTCTGTYPSSQTTRIFLDALWLFYDVESYLFNVGSEIFIPAIRQIVMGYDILIQDHALSQHAEVLPRSELYERILSNFPAGSMERALLVLHCFVPMRDDAQVKFYIAPDEKLAELPSKTNFLLRYSLDDIRLVINHSKTIGKNYQPQSFQLPLEAVCAIDQYLVANPEINQDGKFIFGRAKHSQKIRRWMKKMNIRMKMVDKNGKVTYRGAGIDYFRRVHRAMAGTDLDLLAKTATESCHSATASLKYSAITISEIPQVDSE